MHEELRRNQVIAAIEELGMEGATGALEVVGNPSGVIYLERGHIAFAQASGVPGLAVRLRGMRPVPAGLREALSGRGTEDPSDIGAIVVYGGYLTAAGLAELVHSIVIDAVLVLATPSTVDYRVAALRFAATRMSWTEVFPRLLTDPVCAEAIWRAERMAAYGLAPATTVALRSLALPSAVLTREQWIVACHMTGTMSAVELAPRCGTSLADTVESLSGLIGAGLCSPVRIPRQPRFIPREGAARELQPAQPARPAHQGGPERPSLDVLRQVLQGLRNLS